MSNLIEIIKKISLGAIDSSMPSDVLYGIVTKENPIEITIEQKMVLTKEFLILTKNVVDYTVSITDGNTEKEITIHNSLKLGEKAILIRKKGGQDYIVIDRTQ